jgi:CDP-glucose 4,6-dehydratase
MFNGFYRDKRVLVTGVAGVKGTWLALALLEAGAEVSGVDIKEPDRISNFSAGGLRSRINLVRGDVTDLELMRELVSQADCIFHLAALALVQEAHRSPLEAYRSNTLGTAATLEAIRLSAEPKRAVFVTTDKVYRPKHGELWVESDPLGATGPYQVSKACAESVIADYWLNYLDSAGTRIGVARAGNVVIGGDLHSSRRTGGAGRIFVDCYEALSEGREPEIFSPDFTRPYTYGLDILSGYMTLMSLLDGEGIAGEAFNFGPYEQFGVPNSLLATKICELWKGSIMWKSGNRREEPFDFQSLSTQKSREVLGWRPALTLYEALQATTQWYRKWAELGDNPQEGCMAEFNRQLILEHVRAARNLGVDWAVEGAPARTRADSPVAR